MSDLKIKTANPDVISNIPETLGNIKIKDENGNIRDVKKLYAKTGTGDPVLVWDTTTPPTSTQQTTQPPVECTNCASGSEVYYPEIKALGKRWDYCTWKKTGLLSSCWNNNTTNEGYYTTRQQDPNKLNFLPPPPNYVMGEIVSYTVPDRVLVFVNRPLVSGINGHQDKIFYGSQDNSLNCLLECSTASNCQLNQPTITVCGIGSVTQSIYDVIDERHLLIDTSCIGTGTLNSKIDSCSTYCYGEPDFNTVCRSVNLMHPLYLPLILEDQGICNTQYPDFSRIEPTEVIDPPNLLFANDYQNNNLFLTIKDISVIVEGNCTGNSGTAWTFRLFLPIYVNLPTFRNRYIVVMSTLNDIIQGLLNGSSVNIGLITPGNPNYNPVVHAVYKVLSGQTKISQAIYSSNETTDRWAIIGYPKIPTDLPVPYQNYATHCVMVEISSTSENENGDGCNYCANTPEKSSFKASNLRFYPLEDKNLAPGDYATPLNYYGYNINKISYFTGYNDIDQMNEVYSECYENLGIYYGKTHLNTPQLSFQDFYNAYYQPYITTIEAQDCNTICL